MWLAIRTTEWYCSLLKTQKEIERERDVNTLGGNMLGLLREVCNFILFSIHGCLVQWSLNENTIFVLYCFRTSFHLVLFWSKSPECSLIILLVGLSSVRLFEEYILWCRSLPNSESFLVDQLWMLLEIGRVWCGLRPWFLSVIFVFWMATIRKGYILYPLDAAAGLSNVCFISVCCACARTRCI